MSATVQMSFQLDPTLTQGLKPCLNINCKKEGAKILIKTLLK